MSAVWGSGVDGVAGWSLGVVGLAVWLWLEEGGREGIKRAEKREGVMRIWMERKMG